MNEKSTTAHRALVPLFSGTLFLSAFLLFSVQPMFAKMVLPLLGGTPAVWNTCLVLFQLALLGGYGLVHLVTSRLSVHRQIVLQLVLLALPLIVLPLHITGGWVPPTQVNPIPWLLSLTACTVGPPFLIVSMSAPLLQRWFAQTKHPSAHDPYFLYAASNAGSLIALLSYPFVIEPHAGLSRQSWIWMFGYDALIVLIAICGWRIWRSAIPPPQLFADHPSPSATAPIEREAAPTLKRRLRWILLAAVPSSLMMGVTTYISTDIAAIPLLWVIPLALYLLTFVLAFGNRTKTFHAFIMWLLPFIALSLIIPLALQTGTAIILLRAHLLLFFAAAMSCHGELAKDRPAAAHLTEFYFWLSVGGAVGGMFNALLAPVVFRTTLEYPLAIVLSCCLRSPQTQQTHSTRARWLDLFLPLGLGALMMGLTMALRLLDVQAKLPFMIVLYIPAGLLCYSFCDRPIRFGLGLAVLLLVGRTFLADQQHTLHVARSFFGVYRVTRDAKNEFHGLYHGTTLHGAQSLDPTRQRQPLTYFHPTGPLGQLFETFASKTPALSHVAVIGLGTGSTGCYASPGQQWTFYEIDPLVERIATNPHFFTFTQACLEQLHVVLGDARLSLTRAADGAYDLIIIDAFSSDVIPLHLISLEAIRLYAAKLAPRGLLVLHISNRYFNLEPVLGALANEVGLTAVAQLDKKVSEAQAANGKMASHWVVMARQQADLKQLASDPRWHPLKSAAKTRVWTDDFSDLLSTWKR